jgi:hypothetical protein
MDMQDKEFDQDFSAKFDGFEMEPSPMVWQKVANELDGKKGKRRLLSYLSVAASVIVLIAAGLLFFPQKAKQTKHQAGSNKMAVNVDQPSLVVTGKTSTQPVANTGLGNGVGSSANNTTKQIAPVTTNVAVGENTIADNTQKSNNEPANTDNRALTAAVIEPPREIKQPVIPDKDVLAALKSPGIPQNIVEQPAAISGGTKPNEAPVKKHGIHSLGGLVNVLVAKVDKREDKLIEFTDDDDDNTASSVTGVNLGIIKIKKQSN